MALFSGIGGISIGLKQAIPGLRTVCHVEREPYAVGCLISRMEQYHLDACPIWSDVCTFDGRPWRGVVDIISGGFPCQDISVAGKQAGIKEGTRSGLWFEYARIVGEVRPRFVFVENVAAILACGLDIVSGTLSEMGYDARWGIVSAAEVGALHERKRLFLVAYDDRQRRDNSGDYRQERRIQTDGKRQVAEVQSEWREWQSGAYQNIDTIAYDGSERGQGKQSQPFQWECSFSWCEDVRKIEDLFVRPDIPEPLVRGGSHGIPYRVERTRCLGNAVVPAAARRAAEEMIVPYL